MTATVKKRNGTEAAPPPDVQGDPGVQVAERKLAELRRERKAVEDRLTAPRPDPVDAAAAAMLTGNPAAVQVERLDVDAIRQRAAALDRAIVLQSKALADARLSASRTILATEQPALREHRERIGTAARELTAVLDAEAAALGALRVRGVMGNVLPVPLADVQGLRPALTVLDAKTRGN